MLRTSLMLSLIVCLGSFHQSSKARGGSRPTARRAPQTGQVPSPITMPRINVATTHTPDRIILMRSSFMLIRAYASLRCRSVQNWTPRLWWLLPSVTTPVPLSRWMGVRTRGGCGPTPDRQQQSRYVCCPNADRIADISNRRRRPMPHSSSSGPRRDRWGTSQSRAGQPPSLRRCRSA